MQGFLYFANYCSVQPDFFIFNQNCGTKLNSKSENIQRFDNCFDLLKWQCFKISNQFSNQILNEGSTELSLKRTCTPEIENQMSRVHSRFPNQTNELSAFPKAVFNLSFQDFQSDDPPPFTTRIPSYLGDRWTRRRQNLSSIITIITLFATKFDSSLASVSITRRECLKVRSHLLNTLEFQNCAQGIDFWITRSTSRELVLRISNDFLQDKRHGRQEMAAKLQLGSAGRLLGEELEN